MGRRLINKPKPAIPPVKQPTLPNVELPEHKGRAIMLSVMCKECLMPMTKLRVTPRADRDEWEYQFRCIRCDGPGKYIAVTVSIDYPF